jgi:hypothetical protein
MRVQIPAYTDRWMMGDRFGDVVKVVNKPRPDDVTRAPWCEIAHVKLDKSGKTVRVILSDCTVVA